MDVEEEMGVVEDEVGMDAQMDVDGVEGAQKRPSGQG